MRRAVTTTDWLKRAGLSVRSTRGRLTVFEHNLPDGRLKSFERRFHAVAAWRQVGDTIRPLPVADRLDSRAGGLVDDPDGGAGNRAARRITEETGDRTRADLSTASIGSSVIPNIATMVRSLRDIETPGDESQPDYVNG